VKQFKEIAEPKSCPIDVKHAARFFSLFVFFFYFWTNFFVNVSTNPSIRFSV